MFSSAPPDRGLATQQMSGKKRDKFRITIGVACNADGSEKLPLLFIGRFAKPRCFGRRTPQAHGFDYHFNKTAWMTMIIFDQYDSLICLQAITDLTSIRWLRNLDIKFRNENRRICLLVDNFSAHYIDYQPRNIELVFFEPNLTSHVQPCDAGIIRTLKALYRKAFCLRAVELDEAGEREIYKINLLESMLMVKEAWNQVEASTIRNCWRHTKIQPPTSAASATAAVSTPSQPSPLPTSSSALTDRKAWEVVREFAMSDEMRLPQAEAKLQVVLGDRYVEMEWQPVLKIVMDAENDTTKALDGLDKLTMKHFGCQITQLSVAVDINRSTTQTNNMSPETPATLPQLKSAEDELMKTVKDLQKRKRIIGAPLSLEEMLNPVEELEVGEMEFGFKDDDEIVAKVMHDQAVKAGEIVEIEEDDEDNDEPEDKMTLREVGHLCEQLEQFCIKYGSPDASLDLSRQLRGFRIHLRKTEASNAVQSTLGSWIVST